MVEADRQHHEGHMMLPRTPAAGLIVRHARFAFSVPEVAPDHIAPDSIRDELPGIHPGPGIAQGIVPPGGL